MIRYRRSMRAVRTLLAALLAALLFAPAARAAIVVTEAPCYQEGAAVVTAGLGFVPGGFVTLFLDGQVLGSAAIDSRGVFRNKFTAPPLLEGRHELLHALVASDSSNIAIRHFRTTEVYAGFSPGAGNLGTLRVRFNVNGFGIYKTASKVYLHYVRPNGRLRKTVYLGTASGTCGHISSTPKRLLFPFTAERGVWKLQFDTNKSYEKATAASKFAWVRRPVKVGG